MSVLSPYKCFVYRLSLRLIATYIRGLHEAWARKVLSADAADFTQSYINVQVSTHKIRPLKLALIRLKQYNALLDLASANDTYQYSADWHGPPPSGLQPWGQLEALDTLNGAISFAAERPVTKYVPGWLTSVGVADDKML